MSISKEPKQEEIKRLKKIDKALSKFKDLSETKKEELKTVLINTPGCDLMRDCIVIVESLFSTINKRSILYWQERGWGEESENKALWKRVEHRKTTLEEYEAFIDECLNRYKLITDKKVLEMKQWVLTNHPIPLSKREIYGLITKEMFKSINGVHTFMYEYYMCLGYSEREAKRIISEKQSENANKFSKARKENPERYSDIQPTQLAYWLRLGYSEKEAKLKLKERQVTFSKELCIKKHGYEEGLRVWKERQIKWQNTLQSRPDIEEIHKRRANGFKKLESIYGYERAKEIIASRSVPFGKASKESLKYFIPLYKWLRKKGYMRGDVKFGIKGSKEKYICVNKKLYFYDLTIESLNVIIEFNGTAFHPKTRDQSGWKSPFKGYSAAECFDDYEKKVRCANDAGYDVFIVWSDEELILEKIKNFIIEKERNNATNIIKYR